jgi:hypothetical protein
MISTLMTTDDSRPSDLLAGQPRHAAPAALERNTTSDTGSASSATAPLGIAPALTTLQPSETLTH